MSCETDLTDGLKNKPNPIGTLKTVENVYQSLDDLVNNHPNFTSVRHLLETQKWKTAYERRYSVIAGVDTVFQKERPAGKDWQFSFNSASTAKGGTLTILWDENSISMDFEIDNNTLTLLQSKEYTIYRPVTYTDGTLSFSLKLESISDSINRIEDFKLQSY